MTSQKRYKIELPNKEIGFQILIAGNRKISIFQHQEKCLLHLSNLFISENLHFHPANGRYETFLLQTSSNFI